MATSDKAADTKSIELPRFRVWINLEFGTEDGFDFVRTKLGILDQPVQKSPRVGGSIEQPAVVPTNRSLHNLKSVMLDEAVDELLRLGYVITGAPSFEDRLSDNVVKRKIRIWFSNPSDLGRPDPNGNRIERTEGVETRLVAFLKENVARIVHVKDDNADGSSCIICIGIQPREPGPVLKLHFNRSEQDAGFVFSHVLETVVLDGTRIDSPRRAGLTVTFAEILRERLGRKTDPA